MEPIELASSRGGALCLGAAYVAGASNIALAWAGKATEDVILATGETPVAAVALDAPYWKAHGAGGEER